MKWEWITSGPWIEGKGDTEYKFQIKDRTLHITFKGSTSKTDWKQNFSFWIKPYKQMPVKWFAHSGFVRKWKGIEDEIDSILNKYKHLPVKLYGFSQGGAVAQLAHEFVRFRYPNRQVETISYGSPRVVWFWNQWKLENRFKGLTLIQNRRDIVPNLPPWLFGYKHIGKKEKFSKWYPTFKFEKEHFRYKERF